MPTQAPSRPNDLGRGDTVVERNVKRVGDTKPCCFRQNEPPLERDVSKAEAQLRDERGDRKDCPTMMINDELGKYHRHQSPGGGP